LDICEDETNLFAHDHGFEVEAAVVERSGAHGLERLFTRGCDLVQELMAKVIFERLRRAGVVPSKDLGSS
jgi:hypothetical protein